MSEEDRVHDHNDGGDKNSLKKGKYSLGVLLGLKVDTNVIVTNAFGIRHDKEEDHLNPKFINTMVKYVTKDTKEKIVGMLHVTKENQDINDSTILRAYYIIQSLAASNLILLTLDGRENTETLSIKALLPLDFDFGSTAENM